MGCFFLLKCMNMVLVVPSLTSNKFFFLSHFSIFSLLTLIFSRSLFVLVLVLVLLLYFSFPRLSDGFMRLVCEEMVLLVLVLLYFMNVDRFLLVVVVGCLSFVVDN